MGTMRASVARIRILLVVAALLGVAACGQIDEPYLGAEVTVSSTATDVNPDQPPATGGSIAPVQPSAVLPPRDPNYVPTLIVASATGISAGTLPDLAPLGPPLGTLATVRVSDDLFGGLVVEPVEGGVVWYSAEGAEGEPIAEPGTELLDVGYLDNTAEAIVVDSAKTIERVRLVDRVIEPIITLAETDQLLDFSAAGGLYALVVGDEQCGRIEFVNSLGEPVGIGGPRTGECPVPRRPSFTLVDLGSDGDALAYTEVTYRSDGVEASTTLVGVELSSSAELFRIPVGGAGDRISSLTFDGRRVAFVRTPLEGGDRSVVLIDAVGDRAPVEVVATVSATGPLTVSFARLPLTVGAEPVG
jgi:hypothetical protein